MTRPSGAPRLRGHDARGTPRAGRAAMGGRFAFAVAIAAWLGLAWAPALAPALAIGVTAVALAIAWLPRAGRGLLVLAFLGLGFARGGASGQRHAQLAASFADADGSWRVLALADEPPHREADAPSAVLRVLAASPRLPRGTRVRVRLPAGSTAEWGDTLAGLVRLTAPPGQRVPGGYDARAAARAADIVATGRMFAADVRVARGLEVATLRLAMRVRRAGETAMAAGLSPSARELAAPLLFGDRGGMGTDTDATLRASGLVHLLALSGLHITWVAGVARVLLGALLRGGLRARALAGAAAALAYALIAGPIPSLARAVVAEALTALARWQERALDPLQSLGLAALLLLAAEPAWALDLGFQLSCVATFGLVAIGASAETHLAARLPRAVRALGSAVLLTLGAQVAVVPWLAARFHALPWVALLGNLLAVPLSEGLLAAASLGAFAESMLAGSGHLWFAAGEPLARALHVVVGGLGGWPGALYATGASAWPGVLATIASLLLALGLDPPRAIDARMQWRTSRAVACVAGLAALALCAIVLAATRPLLPARGTWWVVAIDVGQGDATAIVGERGWWLVDTGPRSPRWDAGEAAVLPFLRWAGVRRLSRVLVTHDDGDHTGGFAALRRGIAIGEALGPAPEPGVPGPAAHLPLRTLARGDTLPSTPPARVLWPPRPGDPDQAIASRGDNASSLVLEVGDATTRVLLTADADSLVERALAATPAPALLHAGHHGSGSSSGAGALARLRPRRIVISCGVRNPYGHPNAGALARLAAGGAPIDRTDHEGTLWYELSRDGLRRLDWRTVTPGGTRAPSVRAAGNAGATREY